MYNDELRPYVVDTRAYAGVRERIMWSLRRSVERRLSYSTADTMTYLIRMRAHEDDPMHNEYRIRYHRERIWLRFVWEPLARLLHVDVNRDPFVSNDSIPGKKAIGEFLDLHPHLAHSTAGGVAAGYWLDWFSINPAPWSGNREDWLLWTDDEGNIEADGPLHPFVAQNIFDDFRDEAEAYYDMRMAELYAADGRTYDYPLDNYDAEMDGFDGFSPDPFRTSVAAAALEADEIDWFGDSDQYPEVEDLD